MGVLHVVCIVPQEATRGHQILLAKLSMWELGYELGSSRRVASSYLGFWLLNRKALDCSWIVVLTNGVVTLPVFTSPAILNRNSNHRHQDKLAFSPQRKVLR